MTLKYCLVHHCAVIIVFLQITWIESKKQYRLRCDVNWISLHAITATRPRTVIVARFPLKESQWKEILDILFILMLNLKLLIVTSIDYRNISISELLLRDI